MNSQQNFPGTMAQPPEYSELELESATEIPDMETLDALLVAAQSVSQGGAEPDVGAMELNLLAAEAIDAGALDESQAPTLESIIALAHRYPGLKITLSF